MVTNQSLGIVDDHAFLDALLVSVQVSQICVFYRGEHRLCVCVVKRDARYHAARSIVYAIYINKRRPVLPNYRFLVKLFIYIKLYTYYINIFKCFEIRYIIYRIYNIYYICIHVKLFLEVLLIGY